MVLCSYQIQVFRFCDNLLIVTFLKVVFINVIRLRSYYSLDFILIFLVSIWNTFCPLTSIFPVFWVTYEFSRSCCESAPCLYRKSDSFCFFRWAARVINGGVLLRFPPAVSLYSEFDQHASSCRNVKQKTIDFALGKANKLRFYKIFHALLFTLLFGLRCGNADCLYLATYSILLVS